MKKRILVLCAQARDYRELSLLKENYDFIFHELNNFNLSYCIKNSDEFSDPVEHINNLISSYKDESVSAVISSSDYPGVIFSSIFAEKFNLKAPAVESVILCQHKYYCRKKQREVVSECVPNFFLLENENKIGYPFFAKPIKSVFSINSRAIKNPSDLKDILSLNPLPKNFISSFEAFVKNYTCIQDPTDIFMAEEFITGKQVTVEGFSFQGDIRFLGVVDSNFYPDTICFESFIYPSQLSESVQNRMKDISIKFIKHIEFDNGFFNIEFIYDKEKDKIYLVEINPRIASQFADLYEKVDGINSYQILVDLALNQEPNIKKEQGIYECAGSFVLRAFNDAIVKRVPLLNERERAKTYCPDMRLEIYAKPKFKLSDYVQDGKSFRYAVYNIGAQSREKLLEISSEIKKILGFQFL
jgi:hypothetical protein